MGGQGAWLHRRNRGRNIMIMITRLDKRVVVLNADLIKTIEATPDTIVTLINGDTVVIRESVEEIVGRAIEYQRQIRGFQVV